MMLVERVILFPLAGLLLGLPTPGSHAPASATGVKVAVAASELLWRDEVPPEVGPALPWLDRWTYRPYAELDGFGLVIVGAGRDIPWGPSYALAELGLVVDATIPAGTTGRLFLPNEREDGRGSFSAYRFALPAVEPDAPRTARALESIAEWAAAARLGGRAGSAWFRHLERVAASALGDSAALAESRAGRGVGTRSTELQQSIEFLTGGRAISENLQLDAVLSAPEPGEAGATWIDVDQIPGIDVEPFDWGPLVTDLDLDTDPLGRWIPADQHALFCPSFGALLELRDLVLERGALTFSSVVPPASNDALLRTERQLGLELDVPTRLLGGSLVERVAITGSDPFVRTGTDVTLLFEAKDGAALLALLVARQQVAARALETRVVERAIAGLSVSVARTPDRALSSYVTRRGDVVLLTNSPVGIERFAELASKPDEALERTPEYRFFRARHPRSNAAETAFVILTDATIRRWCGPRWRIAASRRVRLAALLAEHQARFVEAELGLVDGERAAGRLPAPFEDVLVFDEDGVRSELHGSLAFQTPIAEQRIERVTAGEREAYEGFRRGYQAQWSRFFDPIAASLELGDETLGVALTVMPLLGRTDYDELRGVAGAVRVPASAGAVHMHRLATFVTALDWEGPMLQRLDGALRMFHAGRSPVPVLAWVGEWAALTIDAAPIWSELQLEDVDVVFAERAHEFPIALQIAVRDPLGLAGFLLAVRAMVDEIAPNLLQWTTHEEGDQAWVEVSAAALQDGLSLWYGTTPDRLALSFSERTLRRALLEPEPVQEARVGLDASAGARLERGALDVLQTLLGSEVEEQLRRRSWSNLALLNEWHRLGVVDAVAFHARYWDQQLPCPGGGEYVWSEDWATYESTVFGCPAAPRTGPTWPPELHDVTGADLALTFEHEGLSARMRVALAPR